VNENWKRNETKRGWGHRRSSQSMGFRDEADGTGVAQLRRRRKETRMGVVGVLWTQRKKVSGIGGALTMFGAEIGIAHDGVVFSTIPASLSTWPGRSSPV
jgi:hypothetical protein